MLFQMHRHFIANHSARRIDLVHYTAQSTTRENSLQGSLPSKSTGYLPSLGDCQKHVYIILECNSCGSWAENLRRL